MKNKIKKIEMLVITIILIGSSIIIPVSGTLNKKEENIENIYYLSDQSPSIQKFKEKFLQRSENDPFINILTDLNQKDQQSFLDDEFENDMGYNIDASRRIGSALEIYIGEPIDKAPGRTRVGTLEPDRGDDEDWYRFTVCEGQRITASLSSSQNFDVDIVDIEENFLGQSYVADYTGWYFVDVYSNEDVGRAEYFLDLTLENQNDANVGSDAGDTISSATLITPGLYFGYMDSNDVEDWYSFSVDQGEGIYVHIEPMEESDYDIHLYNPKDVLVHSEEYYGEDTLEYPADQSGVWKIKLDIFPGWDTSEYPDNYFLYGSGVYELTFELGGEFEKPEIQITQPQITPVARTFILNDDPLSTSDEYSYIAAIPAANYIEDGNRYVSPIVYRGVDKLTNWFGTVDDSTNYLIDDWNSYLDLNGITAQEYNINADPIIAAAEIATEFWEYSDKAIVVCEGSNLNDKIQTVINGDFSLSSSPQIKRYYPDDFDDFLIGKEEIKAVPMYVGREWGAIHMIALGDDFEGDTGLLTPRYEEVKYDDWPHPYDVDGPDYDTWYPVTKTGLWFPEITSEEGLEELQIIKYPGNRYKIPIDTNDCSIEVSLKTDNPSTLLTYLVDPLGNIRRPMIPKWNGGEIKPIHWWNGGHWEHNFDEYRYWIVEPHTEFYVDLHYPMIGDWTLIVVPYFDHPDHYGEFNGDYHLTVDIRKHNPDRINAAISAANGAVLASLNHAPLLYVKEDSVPSETDAIFSSLNIENKIFVNLNEVSRASLSGSVTELTTMEEILNAIKISEFSENYITITSLGTGKGYFASAAMIAAYHTSPILSIHEASEAYDILDKMVKWEEYTGDHYHGCRTMGHLPAMQVPTSINNPPSLIDLILYYFNNNQQMPPIGLDLQLQWNSQIYESIYSMIDRYNLDQNGQEVYMFVSPRDTDIASHISRVMTGNKSYAGQIPFDTPAMNTALICRDILYPALIYANPGKDVTSVCLMNHWEDHQWRTNDGVRHMNEFTRKVKEYFSSHGRDFQGHTLWSNLLEQYNYGASVIYHSSHGTGGSGICCMYENVEEQFPLAELNHEHLKDFDCWDGWRGYYYDDRTTKTPRMNGRVWFNPTDDPYDNLYDIVHFKWCDQLFDNLHSQINLWQSCTTAHNFGPEIYLEHGAALFYGNSNTGRSPQTDMQDSWWFEDFLLKGLSIGESYSKIIWLFDRDYTTCDPISLYGISSIDEADRYGDGEGLVNTWIVFGDPTLQIYNPSWTQPIPQI